MKHYKFKSERYREEKYMKAKVQITGVIEVVTGMHIGGNGSFAAIGAVDSPVIKDVVTRKPLLPGSSLKGKMRALLANQYNEEIVKRHDDDNEKIVRLFGAAKDNKPVPSRILISDMIMSNWEKLQKKEVQSMTEVKFENSINRQTAVANPRQIERVIRGAEFPLDLIYNVEEESEIEEDMKVLKEGMILLQYDYLGGSGSRGYGKVKFHNLEAKTVIGTVSEEIMEAVNQSFKEVEE